MIYIEDEETDRQVDAFIKEAKDIGATVEIARAERDFRPNQYDRLAVDALALCLRIRTAFAPRTDKPAPVAAKSEWHDHVARLARTTEYRSCPHCGAGVLWQTSGNMGAHPIQYHDCKKDLAAMTERAEKAERCTGGGWWQDHLDKLMPERDAARAEADRLRQDLDTLRAARDSDIRVLRSSVPERWKGAASAVGGAQSYIAELELEIDALKARYHDLIMAVAQKHQDEDRHQTAKRYIMEREPNCAAGVSCE